MAIATTDRYDALIRAMLHDDEPIRRVPRGAMRPSYGTPVLVRVDYDNGTYRDVDTFIKVQCPRCGGSCACNAFKTPPEWLCLWCDYEFRGSVWAKSTVAAYL